jgi:hypothetical protein
MLEKLIYIQIDKNNGGIVLNMAESGLCFQSATPVGHNGSFPFSLVENSRAIAARGEVVWTDQVQQLGGLRFTDLSDEGREQVKLWMSQAVTSSSRNCDPELKFARLNAIGRFTAAETEIDVEQPSIIQEQEGPNRRLVASRFAVGLVTGVLISALGFGLFSFVYDHRRTVGESLIHWGERLAGKAEDQNTNQSDPVPLHVGKVVPAPANIESQTATPPSGGSRAATQVSQGRTPPRPAGAMMLADLKGRSALMREGVSRATSAPAIPAAPVLVTTPAPLIGDLMSSAKLSPPRIDTVEIPAKGNNARFVERDPDMYLELARFTDKTSADKLRTRVAQLGLDASVFRKKRLPWKDSYQVVVGPYSNEEEEKKIVRTLLSSGYRARAYERGSKNFMFPARVTLGGSKVPVGGAIINWESHINHAKVQILRGSDVIKTVTGRWITQPKRYLRNEIVYLTTSDGSKPLLEIHFYGQDRALVFPTPANAGAAGISAIVSSGKLEVVTCDGAHENCTP